MSRSLTALALALAVCTPACDTLPTTPTDGDGGATCEPDSTRYAEEIAPLMDRYCGQCHGETPNFGAPSSLSSEAALLASHGSHARLVDLVAERVATGTMPPAGMPRLAADDAEAIAQWASCGARHADAQAGLSASRSPLLSPAEAPEGLIALDLTAGEHAVAVDDVDAYQCFVFDAELDRTQFVRRFEMIFDETRVLHHVILLRDVERHTEPGSFPCIDGSGMPVGSQYIYAWAPGQGALEFPSGGLRIEPGERFLMQIHYNNAGGLPDVRDSSGVRLYLDEPGGPEYGMIAIGPLNFSVPARGGATASSRCTFTRDTQLLAGMPHMHRHGVSFSENVVRASGVSESLIQLTGWEFESQLFYGYPVALAAGDAITTSCTYRNESAVEVSSGTGTEDEMCFDFVYATPPPTSRYCDEGDPRMPTDVRYVPGECVPAETPSADLALVRGTWSESSSPPVLSPASVPEGRWILESLSAYVSTAVTPIGRIDLERTYVLGRGQVLTRAGHITFDVDSDNVVQSVEGPRFGGPNSRSFGGAFDGTESPAQVALDCPLGGDETVEVEWGLDGDLLTVGFVGDGVPGATLWRRFTFRLQP